jgi:hypothetical protein
VLTSLAESQKEALTQEVPEQLRSGYAQLFVLGCTRENPRILGLKVDDQPMSLYFRLKEQEGATTRVVNPLPGNIFYMTFEDRHSFLISSANFRREYNYLTEYTFISGLTTLAEPEMVSGMIQLIGLLTYRLCHLDYSYANGAFKYPFACRLAGKCGKMVAQLVRKSDKTLDCSGFQKCLEDNANLFMKLIQPII